LAELVEDLLVAGGAGGVAFGGEEFEGGEEADDGLFADLGRAADAVGGEAGEALFIDEGGRGIPGGPVEIEVEVLENGGHDEVAAAAEDTGALGAVDGFAAGEGDEVGAGGGEGAEVGDRGELSGGIDEDGKSMLVGQFDDGGEWGLGAGVMAAAISQSSASRMPAPE
jgi:hypothetical protein